MSTYPNSSIKIEWDNRTGQLLKGTVFLKVDSGTGRLSKSKDNVDFRQQMWESRIVVMLGLTNSTEVTQEMDDLYQTFKPQTYASTKRATSLKIAQQVSDRRKE